MLTDILDQNLCRQAGLDVMNFLTFLIRIALLKFCLHSLLNKLLTSSTKSFNTEDDFAIRYNSPTKIPYACLLGMLDRKFGILTLNLEY